ncbi:hypothetical protein BTUL_0007g00750 [Botrytis tulipae]|uniref:Uncharacterized protein n=1 Tax=Botrytis tulipae TaxID=87230 RepID=A0A4Z1FBM7_9HELO|nr:hypothetical protein BTUL_0007g00750 [Botrytis tulipae]
MYIQRFRSDHRAWETVSEHLQSVNTGRDLTAVVHWWASIGCSEIGAAFNKKVTLTTFPMPYDCAPLYTCKPATRIFSILNVSKDAEQDNRNHNKPE